MPKQATKNLTQAFCAVCHKAVELPHLCPPSGVRSLPGEKRGGWQKQPLFGKKYF